MLGKHRRNALERGLIIEKFPGGRCQLFDALSPNRVAALPNDPDKVALGVHQSLNLASSVGQRLKFAHVLIHKLALPLPLGQCIRHLFRLLARCHLYTKVLIKNY